MENKTNLFLLVAFATAFLTAGCLSSEEAAKQAGSKVGGSSRSGSSDGSSSSAVTSNKILMVVSNKGFYYQEYADPRREIETAGFIVEVAAGQNAVALAHANTGQPVGNSGNITPDLALADVDVTDYAALVIVGGWGAGNYYYAYNGSIDDANWAPIPAQATQMNNIITAFLAAGKYVVGICNGVNVLAWARVGGASPIAGKNVVAPYGGAPTQTYAGVRRVYPSLPMMTFASDNGANVSAENSVGDRTSPNDDIMVDGLIITAQDNNSAWAAGRKLGELL